MNKITLIALCLAFVIFSSFSVWAGPEEMTESQMTDMSVDDTVISTDQDDMDGTSTTAKATLGDQATRMNLIKNPVDDPTLLNQAEILRLERQAADQRVNDQIQNTIQIVPNP